MSVPPRAPVQIFDSELNFVAEVDTYSSLVHNRGWNAPGSFELRINWNITDDSGTIQYAALFEIGGYVTIDNDGTKCAIITGIEKPIDESGKQSMDITVMGHEPTVIFNRRMVVVPTGEDFYELNAPAETVIKTAISDQAGPTATNANRAFSLLSIAADQARGGDYLLSAAYTELLGELTACSVATRLGFFITLDRTNRLLVLDCALGDDLTAGNNPAAIFSTQYDTLRSADLKESNEQFKNLATVAGQGTGQNRTVLDVYSDSEPSDFGRFEIFVNANNLTSTPDLTAKAQQALDSYSYTKTVDASALAQSPLVYGESYNLGDFVTVAAYDFSDDVQITGIQESWAPLEYDLVPTFDKAPPIISSQMATATKTVGASVSNLGLPTDVSAGGQTLSNIGGVILTPFVEDTRITTGTTDRTETVLDMSVGQTTLINWSCGVTGGVTRNITYALPAVGTYQIVAQVDSVTTNSFAFYPASNPRSVTSGGSAPSGSTIVIACTSGASLVLMGTIKRLT